MELLAQRKICETCGSILDVEMPSGFCPGCLLNTVLVETATELVPGSRINDYELLDEVAHGGMGIVYRARQLTPSRIVALKMILPAHVGSVGAINRFYAEAEAAASLDHEGILPIYAVGEADRAPFYSMKFADGGTLTARIDNYRDKPREAAALVSKLARAVAFAHEHGILHRDLKPGNVLFDAADKPYVSDFGLAKWLQRECDLTQTLAILGTPYYMAPEQATDSRGVTAAADVYSLGAILYHLLAGRPPTWGETPMEVLHRAATEKPKSPRLTNARISRDLETICLKGLEKEPGARYASAAALADDLERFCAGHTIRARPVSPANRAWRWTRRNPVLAGLSGILLTLVALLVGIVWREPIPHQPEGLAVLPFENLNHDPENAYLADSLQDEILMRLSKIADLKVIPRTSTQHYKSVPENLPEIANQLGVTHIVEGSVYKAGDHVRVDVQLIKAATDSHLWAQTFDSTMTDIVSIHGEVAKAIANRLRGRLSREEEHIMATRPTDSMEAYDAYLRGLAYSLKPVNTPDNPLRAQKYLREAVRLDPKFALGWALLARVDASGYLTLNLEPTAALREETRQAAETALNLQPDLGEALWAKGHYYYGCLKDYETAARYFEQARRLLPSNSQVRQSLAYVARRRGQWQRSESYFNEVERLDPRGVGALSEHALSYIYLRRFPEALEKLDQLLDITPDELDAVAQKAAIAQAQGDLLTAATLLAPLHPTSNDFVVLEAQAYQAILERRPAQVTGMLMKILADPDPTLGFYNGELRFWLGWAQDLAGDHAAARETWRRASTELESFIEEQPDNFQLVGDLALTHMALGNKATALAFAEQAVTALPIEKDAVFGPMPIEILARVAARTGDADRAIAGLKTLLSIPGAGAVPSIGVPLTPALLRLDPMFDPLRNDPRFQELAQITPKTGDK